MSAPFTRLSASSAESNIQCPVCRAESQRRFEKEGHWIRRCVNCMYQFLEELPLADHVESVYGDDYFFGGGAGYPDYVGEGALVRAHGQRYAKLLNRYMSPGLVIDIGAAAGFFLLGLQDGGWHGGGLEPNGNMARFGREKLGVDVVPGTLERLPETVSAQSYDLVSMVQVVPHFYDLHVAFRSAAAITKRGGYWLIETWNAASMIARIFGRQWHEYSPPSVVRWFSPSNLEALCKGYGFSKVASGRPSKWINGAHVKSLLGHKLTTFPLNLSRPLLKLVPDRLKIPYPSEDLFWMLLRKS